MFLLLFNSLQLPKISSVNSQSSLTLKEGFESVCITQISMNLFQRSVPIIEVSVKSSISKTAKILEKSSYFCHFGLFDTIGKNTVTLYCVDNPLKFNLNSKNIKTYAPTFFVDFFELFAKFNANSDNLLIFYRRH